MKNLRSVLPLSFLLSLVGILLLPPPAKAQVELTWARIQYLSNRVQLIPNGSAARPARISDLLNIGDALRTASSSRAELQFNDGSIARIGERATFRFTPNTRNFQLSNGTVLLLVPPGRGRSTIQTPNAVTGIQGSALFVRFIPETNTTIIGALTDNPDGPMVAYNQDGSQQRALSSGELIVVEGSNISPPLVFDLRTFYTTSGLVDGLNINTPEISTGSPGIDAVRQEITDAIQQQVPVAENDAVENPTFLTPPPADPQTESQEQEDAFTDSDAAFEESPAADYLEESSDETSETTNLDSSEQSPSTDDEDTPSEDTPSEDTPSEDTLSEDTPSEDNSSNEAGASSGATSDTPENDTPENEVSNGPDEDLDPASGGRSESESEGGSENIGNGPSESGPEESGSVNGSNDSPNNAYDDPVGEPNTSPDSVPSSDAAPGPGASTSPQDSADGLDSSTSEINNSPNNEGLNNGINPQSGNGTSPSSPDVVGNDNPTVPNPGAASSPESLPESGNPASAQTNPGQSPAPQLETAPLGQSEPLAQPTAAPQDSPGVTPQVAPSQNSPDVIPQVAPSQNEPVVTPQSAPLQNGPSVVTTQEIIASPVNNLTPELNATPPGPNIPLPGEDAILPTEDTMPVEQEMLMMMDDGMMDDDMMDDDMMSGPDLP